MAVEDLPDGWQPVDALIIMKCIVPPGELDQGGTTYPYRLAVRATEGLSSWEVVGMCRLVAAEGEYQYTIAPDAGED